MLNFYVQVLASTLLSLISLLLTGILHTCFFLSPLFSIISNVTVFLLYIVGYVLLTWNIYGTLGHSCSRANWASDDGMMVCRTYKALYSFEIFGVIAQIALIVLDIRSRRKQTRQGRYDSMANLAAKGGADVKLDDIHDRPVDDVYRPGVDGHADSQDSIPYGVGEYNPNMSPDSHTRLRDNAGDMGLGYGRYHPNMPVQMEDFRNDSSTSGFSYNAYRPPQNASYGDTGYGYGPQR